MTTDRKHPAHRRHLSALVAAGSLALATSTVIPTSTAASATEPRRPPAPSALQERLDDVRDAGAVGVLARVRLGDRGWRGTSGVAEIGSRRPVPAHGRFRAGSITKTFLATVVLQLVDEGRLGLDDPVETWLPGAVPGGDRITLRHLLGHTSGIPDYRPTIPLPPSQAFLDNRWRTWTAAELVQRAVATPPDFEPPGSRFSYSNTNYTLLGMVVERVTGRGYGAEIARRILRPLHLDHSSMPGTEVRIRGPHPRGYVPLQRSGEAEPVLVDFTEMNPSLFGAGGELVSTSKDLDRFFAALLGGRLLPPDLLETMMTPGTPGGRYGLGLSWRDTRCGLRVYGNDGDALSYQSWSFATEDLRHRVTLALTPDFRGDVDDTVDAVLDELFCDGTPRG